MASGDRYENLYLRSLEDRDGFWREAASLIDWVSPPGETFDGATWFNGGQLNICQNAVDRHVSAGRGMQAALTTALSPGSSTHTLTPNCSTMFDARQA